LDILLAAGNGRIRPAALTYNCAAPSTRFPGGSRLLTDEENRMKIRSMMIAACLALASGAAFAFHCPADMKKIDEAMAKNPNLSPAQMADVKKFRSEGEAFHKAGKHQDSVDTLAKAMKILDIK
jgi:hypothetical protein